jgi:protein phosphatase
MGTTLVGLVFSDDAITSLYVGDSRAYRIRNEKIVQLSEDHTLIKELIKTGTIDPSKEDSHPISHMLTKSLGPVAHIHVDCNRIDSPAEPSDTYILCSDGLHNYVSEDEILSVVVENPPDDASQILINLANQRGGADNITLLIVSVDFDQPVRINRLHSDLNEVISDQDTYPDQSSSHEVEREESQPSETISVTPPPVQEPRDVRAARRILREQRRATSDQRRPYSTALLIGITLVVGLIIGNIGQNIISSSSNTPAPTRETKPTFSDIIANFGANASNNSSDTATESRNQPPRSPGQRLSEIKQLVAGSTDTRSTPTTSDALPATKSEIAQLTRELDIWKRRIAFLALDTNNYKAPLLLDALEDKSPSIRATRIRTDELSAQIVATENYAKIHPNRQQLDEELSNLRKEQQDTEKKLRQSVYELVKESTEGIELKIQALRASDIN